MNGNKFHLFDTTTSSSTLTSISSSSPIRSSSTYHPFYPDTYNPGAIVGFIIGALIFLCAISIGAYYIRRQRLYYLPYYDNYRPI